SGIRVAAVLRAAASAASLPSGAGAAASLIQEDVAPGGGGPDADSKAAGDVDEADDKKQEKRARYDRLDRHELDQHAHEQDHREHVINDGAPARAPGRLEHVDQENYNRTRNHHVARRDPPFTSRNHVDTPDFVVPREPR